MKISTIHSFKGWESKLVVLVIDSYAANDKAIDEIVYTGITRCKEHLYIINMNNSNYDKKITSLLNNI
jgi:ATP-dependent exoDNAse (exonuclease V) alpha subunit